MEWSGPVRPTYFDLPEDLRHAIKAEAAKRRVTLRAAVQEALEEWLQDDQRTAEEDIDATRLREFKRIAKPDDIKHLGGVIYVYLRDAERERKRKGA